MSDAVELMEFWPVDADENIGFVAADSDFQLWLLDGIGISFDDISYSVIDGPDNSGIYELVLDYEDYTTLNELYASYLGDNEYASEGSLPQMDYSWINYGKGKVYGEKEAIKMLKQQIKKDFPKEKIQSISVEQFDSGEWRGEVKFGSEEDSAPIMDPMDFGEPVNWTPLDGTPSLKRRKDAEDEPLFKTQKEIDEHKQWLKESKEKFPEGEVRVVGRDKIDKRSALGKMMSRWDATTQKEDYAYLGPIEWLDEEKLYTPRESGELFGPSSDDEDARDEWNDKMGVCLHDWQDDRLEITGKGYDRSYDITAYCPTCDTTVLITYIHYDSDKTETIFLPGKLSASDFQDNSPPRAYGQSHYAEGANPSGGATGDQIISWEHNGLSSPSGPPSDIMWAEEDWECGSCQSNYLRFYEHFDKEGRKDESLDGFFCGNCELSPCGVYQTDSKPCTCDISEYGKYTFLGRKPHPRYPSQFEEDARIRILGKKSMAETFDAHSLHRFTQKDSRPMDIGITRQKIKKEMFSEVSSFMTLKNLAVLTAAGMAGYLIAGRK